MEQEILLDSILIDDESSLSFKVKTDLLQRICEGQLLYDIIVGKEEIPEYLELEEALLIRCYLPEERQNELDRFVRRFRNSISDAKDITDFNGWFRFYYESNTNGKYRELLAFIMMTYTATSYSDWTTLFHMASSSPYNFFALKRFAYQKMALTARSDRERANLKKIARELGVMAKIKEG